MSLNCTNQQTIELTSAGLSAVITWQHRIDVNGYPADCQIKVLAWSLSSGTAVRRARRLLRAHLSTQISDETVLDDLEVMVSELATNAAMHTDGPAEMRILHHGNVPVVCEIVDTGGGLDEIAHHLHCHTQPADTEQTADIDVLQPSGRGLGIVTHLSAGRCGAQTTRLCSTGQPGKSVWFAIPCELQFSEGAGSSEAYLARRHGRAPLGWGTEPDEQEIRP